VVEFVPVEANIPLAPPEGAVNVTATPLTEPVSAQPLLFASVTCRLVANAEPTLAVCGLPATSLRSFGLHVGVVDVVPVVVGVVDVVPVVVGVVDVVPVVGAVGVAALASVPASM
jgi:hypothetical protein